MFGLLKRAKENKYTVSCVSALDKASLPLLNSKDRERYEDLFKKGKWFEVFTTGRFLRQGEPRQPRGLEFLQLFDVKCRWLVLHYTGEALLELLHTDSPTILVTMCPL